jgi:hypothetical protein
MTDKMIAFTTAAVTAAITVAFFVVTMGIPYLVARKRSGAGWAVLAYVLGTLAGLALWVGAKFVLEAQGVPPMQASRMLAPGMGIALFGPAFGLWWARRGAREPRNGGDDRSEITPVRVFWKDFRKWLSS